MRDRDVVALDVVLDDDLRIPRIGRSGSAAGSRFTNTGPQNASVRAGCRPRRDLSRPGMG
jgi:hypothetical protein